MTAYQFFGIQKCSC